MYEHTFYGNVSKALDVEGFHFNVDLQDLTTFV